jgi:hypothetical protein
MNFWKGKDVKLLISFREAKLIVNHSDMEVTRKGEEIADGVCGEDRDRLDFVTSHFDVSINGWQEKLDAIAAFITEQKAKDARELPKQSSVGILIFPEDGTQAAFQCREYILGEWKMGWGGRKERNKLTMPGRCRYFDALKTV